MDSNNTNTNTFSIRTYEDDVKGRPSQTGNFQVNAPSPTIPTSSQPLNGAPPTGVPNMGGMPPSQGQVPASNQMPATPPGTPSPQGGMPMPNPTADSRRAGLASSAMKEASGKSRSRLYIILAVIVIVFMVVIGGIYFLSSSGEDDGILGSISSLLGISDSTSDTTTETEETEETQTTEDELSDVTKVIPNTFGYYIRLTKGTGDSNGMVFDMLQTKLLEETFSSELYDAFEIDYTNDFIWNTDELYFIPDGQELPSNTGTSPDGLIVMSIDYKQDAEDFFDNVQNNELFVANNEENASEKEIWQLKNTNNLTLFMTAFDDYLLMSPNETVITNTLDLINSNQENTNPDVAEDGVEGMTDISNMKLVFSDNLIKQLEISETLSVNFREKLFSFPANVIDWENLSGVYLFATLEDTDISYAIAIDKLKTEFQAAILSWESASFNHLKNFYSDITLNAPLVYSNEPYESFYKRYIELQNFGSPRQATISYIVMNDVIIIGSSDSIFDEAVQSYLGTSSLETSDNDDEDTEMSDDGELNDTNSVDEEENGS